MKQFVTCEDSFWQERDLRVAATGEALEISEALDKPLYGFGCCLSEICIQAIRTLDETKQKEIFRELFSEEGCGFSFCRLSIGANDFAESWYSYNETDGDYAMEHFSIDRDRKFILPAVKQAMEYSPRLRFFASPWSPPTWMKFPKVCNHGRIVETEENLRAYALYFKKYLEAYRAEGVQIDQIHVQNEFHSDQKFPSCVWTGDALINFMVNYLAPALGDSAELWFGTDNGPENDHRLLISRYRQFFGKAMQNPDFRKIVSGVSYQWAGKFGITQAAEDYPEMNLLNGEMECGDGKNTWEYARYSYEMMHHYFKHGSRACVYWNIALTEGATSTWGWKQNSLITVTKDGDYRYNPDFYVIKHYARFVREGAVMLKTKGGWSTNTTLFRNPDGSTVAVVMNPFDFEKDLTLMGETFRLPPRSFVTLVF